MTTKDETRKKRLIADALRFARGFMKRADARRNLRRILREAGLSKHEIEAAVRRAGE